MHAHRELVPTLAPRTRSAHPTLCLHFLKKGFLVVSENCTCTLSSGTRYNPSTQNYTITVAYRNLRRVLLNFSLELSWRQNRALDSRTRTTMSTRFSHRTTVSMHKPASFWQEKRDTVIILVQGLAKMFSC